MARILVVDDDESIRMMLRLILEGEGYEVTEADDGDKAIKAYRQEQCDLIITDIVMPEKEGLQMIMELKKDFPDVKIIVMSGGGRVAPTSYLNLAQKLGANRAFSKPFERKKLVDAVKELIGE